MDKQEEEKKIRDNPYEYILNWIDKSLIVVGKQSFKILALMPHSLFLPDIQLASTNIRSNINNLIIASPGTGKSTLAKKFALLSYQPLVRRVITANDLIDSASTLKWMTIIIEDLSQTADQGYDVIKVIEGIVGEERSISKSTMTKKYTGEVRGIGFLGVTPQDLEKFSHEIESGLLSRCTVTLIRLTNKDYQEIAEFINLRAGDSAYTQEINLMEEVVIDYYNELRKIQQGKHNDYLTEKYGKKHGKIVINPVTGYQIEDKFKKELLRKWNKISENIMSQGSAPNNRDLHEYYRFLCSSAFLNIYNRKHDNGILVPNEEDHKLALELTITNMRYKWAIPLALKSHERIKSLDALEKIMNQGMPEVVRDVLKNISPYAKFLKD